ncbi:MAG: hypothetical protein AAFR38_14765 [Planctomycetota bacterium]
MRAQARIGPIAIAATAGLATGQAIITPVNAVGPVGFSGSNVLHTIDGSGLSGPASAAATHSATVPTNSYAAGFAAGPLVVVYDLGGVFSVNGGLLWNQNAGGPGPNGITGVASVFFEGSLDGVNFFALGNANFLQEMGGISAAQGFAFAGANTAFVRLTVNSNHGDTVNSGLAEIRFIPNGSAAALLGFGGLVAARRRR